MIHPLRLELTNVPSDFIQLLEAPKFPREPSLGTRVLPITSTVYVEQGDFREVDEPSFYGLAPGKTVGLRYAGYVKVTEVLRGSGGEVVGLRGLYDGTRGEALTQGIKGPIKGNLHWVSASAPGGSPVAVEIREYDHLFLGDSPGESGDWESELNPLSERIFTGLGEASLASPGVVTGGSHFQFERVGFYVADRVDSKDGALVFNSTVALKESTETKKIRS